MMKLFKCILYVHLVIAVPSVANWNLRWPKQADVEIRKEASATSDVTYRLSPEYPVILLAEKDEWCHVAVYSDTSKTGAVLCNQLTAERLNDTQLFWLSPSIERFKGLGVSLNNQLTEEQKQAEYNRYYAFLETYNAAYDSLTDEEKEERLQNGPPDLTIHRPANPEFDAFKKLLAKGIKVKDDLLWVYDTPARLTSDDPNALNAIGSQVKDILLAMLHNNLLPQIKPSFFESANEVLFVGADVNVDNLSVVADTSLKAEVVKPAYVTYVREPYIVGYWDVGELKVTFTKPLSIYSIAKNGLTGKAIGNRFSDSDTYDVCDGIMRKLLPADLMPLADYPQANNPIVEIYSRKNIPPQVNVRTRTHRLRNLLPDEELITLHLHSIDINKDDLADILVGEGEVPSQMYEGEFKFWSIYFVNIKGNWYFANDFVTPECT